MHKIISNFKVYTEWKSFTRKKARQSKPLNDLEKKLLNITGDAAVSGVGSAELGLPVAQFEETSETVPTLDDDLVGICVSLLVGTLFFY